MVFVAYERATRAARPMRIGSLDVLSGCRRGEFPRLEGSRSPIIGGSVPIQ
jgi:hypothetical protein